MRRRALRREIFWSRLYKKIRPLLKAKRRGRLQQLQEAGVTSWKFGRYARGIQTPYESVMRRMAKGFGISWSDIAQVSEVAEFDKLNNWQKLFTSGKSRLRAFHQVVLEVFLFYREVYPNTVYAFSGQGEIYQEARLFIPIRGKVGYAIYITGGDCIYVEIFLDGMPRSNKLISGELTVSLLSSSLHLIHTNKPDKKPPCNIEQNFAQIIKKNASSSL